MNFKKALLGVLLLGVLPLFIQLGGRGLNEPDEGRYVEIGREMLATGDWLVPKLNGVPHYAKPPWIYWCIAASLKIFGMNEFGARFPSALAAAVALSTTFALGNRMRGPLAGFLSALFLSSTLLFFGIARLITTDMMLAACVSVALYCFWRWWEGREREVGSVGWLIGMYAALGIGFLDKGFVPSAVVFLTILGFFIFQRKTGEILKLHLLKGFLLVALMGLPWFLILCHRNPDLYSFYLGGEVRDRIFEGRGRSHPFYYHLLWLPGDCWPWTLLWIMALIKHFRGLKEDRPKPVSSFLLAWFLLPLLMFSCVRSKLPTYILPIFPSISLMLGTWMTGTFEDKSKFPRWVMLFTWAMFLVFPCIGFFHPLFDFAQANIPWTPDDYSLLFLIVVMTVVFAMLTWWLVVDSGFEQHPLSRPLAVWFTGSFIVFQIFLFTFKFFETQLGHNASWRSLTRKLQGMDLVGCPINPGIHPTGKKPEFIRPGPRVAMYECAFRSGDFYLMGNKAEVAPIYGNGSLWELPRDAEKAAITAREDIVALLKSPERVYVFTPPQYYDDLKQITHMRLPLLDIAGKGEHTLVLFSNKTD